MKRLLTLLLALVMVLALAVPALAEEASGTTITLDAGKGTFGSSSTTTVEVTDGKVPTLPNPSRDLWDFKGWYTLPPTEGMQGTYGDDFSDMVEVIKPNGRLVQEGDVYDAEEMSTLYAYYYPQLVHFGMCSNGWLNNGLATLYCTRKADDAKFYETVYGLTNVEWPGYEWTGWYDAQIGGNPIHDGETVKDGAVYYLHWKKTDNSYNSDMFAAGEGNKYTGPQPVTGITVTGPLTLSCGKMQDQKIYATIQPNWHEDVTLTWKSDKPEVATVEGKGTTGYVTGHQVGTANITVEVTNSEQKTFSATCVVTVTDRHNWNNGRVLKWGGCTEECVARFTCKTCGTTKDVTYPPDGHRFIYSEKQASCTAEGHKHWVCVVCGYEEDVKIDAEGHKMKIEGTEAGCGGTVTTEVCTVCGYKTTITDTSAAVHAWDTAYTVDKAATCAAEGSQSIHCTHCSATKNTQSIPATGEHSYGEWQETKAPTTEEFGLKERTCSVCGAKETEQIEKLNAPELSQDVIEQPTGTPAPQESAKPTETPAPQESTKPSESPAPEESTKPTETPAPQESTKPSDPEPVEPDEPVVSPDPEVTPKPEDPGAPEDPAPENPDIPEVPENGTGWRTGESGTYYYFEGGKCLSATWVQSEKGLWYYLNEDGSLATGFQYVNDARGTGFFFLSESGDCIGTPLVGWQKLGLLPDGHTNWGWFETKHNGYYGACTYTTAWGDFDHYVPKAQ